VRVQLLYGRKFTKTQDNNPNHIIGATSNPGLRNLATKHHSNHTLNQEHKHAKKYETWIKT